MRIERSRSRGGLTLIEVMVVILILGILLAIGGTVTSVVLTHADEKQTVAWQKVIMEAVERYRDEEQTPPSAADMQQLFAVLAGNATARKVLQKLPPEAIRKNADDSSSFLDAWGNEMEFRPTGGLGGTPVLISSAGNMDGSNAPNYAHEDAIRSDEN